MTSSADKLVMELKVNRGDEGWMVELWICR